MRAIRTTGKARNACPRLVGGHASAFARSRATADKSLCPPYSLRSSQNPGALYQTLSVSSAAGSPRSASLSSRADRADIRMQSRRSMALRLLHRRRRHLRPRRHRGARRLRDRRRHDRRRRPEHRQREHHRRERRLHGPLRHGRRLDVRRPRSTRMRSRRSRLSG